MANPFLALPAAIRASVGHTSIRVASAAKVAAIKASYLALVNAHAPPVAGDGGAARTTNAGEIDAMVVLLILRLGDIGTSPDTDYGAYEVTCRVFSDGVAADGGVMTISLNHLVDALLPHDTTIRQFARHFAAKLIPAAKNQGLKFEWGVVNGMLPGDLYFGTDFTDGCPRSMLTTAQWQRWELASAGAINRATSPILNTKLG